MEDKENPVEISMEEAMKLREKCNKHIALAESLTRLHNNADFKKVFLDFYVNEEPSRMVLLLADTSLNHGGKKAEHREDLQESMIGIARFAEFIRNVYNIADHASYSLERLNQATITEK